MLTTQPKYRLGIFWFTNDLRLNEHALLARAAQECQYLMFIFIKDLQQARGNRFVSSRMSPKRSQFQWQALKSLNTDLKGFDQCLFYAEGEPILLLETLLNQIQPMVIYRSQQPGSEENSPWNRLKNQYTQIEFITSRVQTIYCEATLPITIDELPETFSKFRKQIELNTPDYADVQLQAAPSSLPPSPTITSKESREANKQGNLSGFVPVDSWQSLADVSPQLLIKPGENEALNYLKTYFNLSAASTYKETRNALDGQFISTGFSPWLANGNLSPRQILAALGKYQQRHGQNESTYWIYFELLWREYFQLYAYKHGDKLFNLRGINNKPVKGCLYGERLARWINGTTPYPLVNACMNQLKESGLLSNRGRQIVASCLIHELQLDWRAGAYYFEQQLLDYDVASNWGNWQYIAGVGADPRQGRHFNLIKQQQTFDPEGKYIARWRGDAGDSGSFMDSVDAADWPIYPSLNRH